MAHSFLHATLTIVNFLIITSILRTKAQITTPCSSSMISTFTPCINFVTGSSGTGSSPTQDCCNSLKSLMTNNMDCVCLIVTGNVPISIPFVNASLAISLPRACKNSVPLQCKATGVPLPPPGPVLFGPTPAPAPAHGHASTPVPAPAGPPAQAPAPHGHSPKASKAGVAVVAAPPPAESLDITPVAAAPPKFSLGPTVNPGIRPVVNHNSASSPSITVPILPLSIVVTCFGIMTSKSFD